MHSQTCKNHTVLSFDLDAEMMRDFARMMDIEFEYINKDTTPEQLEKEIARSDIVWKLKA